MADELSKVEQNVLFYATVEAIAESLLIAIDAAVDLLVRANSQGRVAILGNDYFAGVQVDGKWVFVQGRKWLERAADAYSTMEFMERQFEK